MMNRLLTVSFGIFLFTGMNAPAMASAATENSKDEPKAVRISPPAPKFTDQERQAELARRRAALASKMSDKSMLILSSAQPRLYSNDVDYVYRQENNLFYLTGLAQNNATLVITKDGTSVREFIFIPKRNPQLETWYGKMYSNEDAAVVSGITTIVDAVERPEFIKALTEKRAFSSAALGGSVALPNTLYLLLPLSEKDINGAREFAAEISFAGNVKGSYQVENARPALAALRQIKSPYELALLQHAVDITTEGQMRAMATVGGAKKEYEVQAEIEFTFRRRNADFWGYPSIVGSGPNATTLHYVESQGDVQRGDLMLTDAGAEYQHYTADVTRTYPVNGKFSKEQAEIYQIVYDAQEAVAKAARPGATMQQLNEIANNAIRDGLFRLGLVTDKNSQQHRIWFMHGIGHLVGMNVHDVGVPAGPMQAGMVFTNEPGIYIRADALDYLPNTPENKAFVEKVRPAFEKYKNIGVRIEDDLLVTPTGVEWMTAKLPRRIDEIEKFMSGKPAVK